MVLRGWIDRRTFRPRLITPGPTCRAALLSDQVWPRRGYNPFMLHQVGIRELKDTLSAVLHRVQEGEPIEVTDNGRPIVRMVPIRPVTVTERLVAEGTLVLALDQDSAWPDPEPTPHGERPMSEIVIEMRADERS
jgi:prevent-host-death family protein